MIKEEDWKVWRRDEVTLAFVAELQKLRKDFLDAWASGSFTTESSEGTAQKNAKALGSVEMLDLIMEVWDEQGK